MNPSDSLRKVRNDLSPYLFHFTSNNPVETLKTILQEKRLYSETKEYVCFTETPITAYCENLEYMQQFTKPMYSKYGVGFNRDILFKDYGARPVIYGDEQEGKRLKDIGLYWRFELLDIHSHDFTWLREWRILGEFNFSNLSKEEIIIVAPTEEDLRVLVTEQDLVDIDFSYESDIRGCIAFPIFAETIAWKGFSFAEIKQAKSDYEVSGKTHNQVIGEYYSESK